ncbi:hypothetical protein [Thermococcus sp. MAR1]|uniref:hypothetical protein n=1 Tax=Thermococcus sp. MAR1 TaxID=1638263 RepID=UPI001981D877|nr:hypothetical protein [Thermococcus sp. MAR1]
MSGVDEKEQRLVEYSIEAVIIAWLAYLFFYQNYLLHSWHRGLPLPSKLPFLVAGIVVAALFFWYEWAKFERELEGRKEVPLKSVLPVALKEDHIDSDSNKTENGGETTGEEVQKEEREEVRASAPESPQEP